MSRGFKSDRTLEMSTHLHGEVDGPVVRLETNGATLLQNGLMGSVKPFPEARDPVVVNATRMVILLVVIFFMVSQQVGVKITVGEPFEQMQSFITVYETEDKN